MCVDYGASFVQCWAYDPMNNFGGLYGDRSAVGSYLNTNGSYSFDYNIGSLRQVVGNGSVAGYWHHYAYSIDFISKRHYLFLDGRLVRSTSNPSTGSAIRIHPCCISTYDGGTKYNIPFYLTQLAVWDYPKYLANFNIPQKPYI